MAHTGQKDTFEDAIALIEAGERDKAREALQALLSDRPDFVEARLALGILLGGAGDQSEARRHLRIAMEQLRADARVGSHALRAQVLVNLCALSNENDDWEDVLAWEDVFGELHEALQRQGLLGRAATVLFRAANRAVHVRRIDSARKLYERAIQLEPSFGEAWYNLAVLASEAQDLDEARRCLRHAVEADPDFADARFLLGSLLLPDDADEAIAHMERAIALAPDNPRWLTLLATAYAQRRDYERTRELLAASLELDEEQADAHLGLAVASRALNDMESARKALRRAFQLNPELANRIHGMMNE